MTLSETKRGDGPPPKVSIVTVTYNSNRLLDRLLDCLDAQEFQDFELIVIDNGSTETLPESARERIETRGKLIVNTVNTGFAAANNQAARLASAPWIALLNPDAFPEPGWLSAFQEALLAYPNVQCFGSTQLLDRDPRLLDGAGDVYHVTGIPFRGGYLRNVPADLRDGQSFTACAAAAFWLKERFLDLGGFDEDFFCYCEDVDLGFRHRLAGGLCVQLARARVRHIGSASSSRYSPFAVYHGTRNRLWVFARCMPAALIVVFGLGHLAATLVLWLHAWRRGCGGAYSRGLSDGLMGLGKALTARKAIQARRTASLWVLLGQFAWSPLSLQRRAVVLRSVPAPIAG